MSKTREHDNQGEAPTIEVKVNAGGANGADVGEAAVREERDRLKDQLLRTRAEFDNYQKRAARERDQERRYAQTGLATDLLPAIDNLDRFLANVKDDSALTQVVALVRAQLLDTLKKYGITPIAAEGQPFDPNLHMAVMQQPSDKPANTVVQSLETGYQYHDRVLRPSKVIVAKAAE